MKSIKFINSLFVAALFIVVFSLFISGYTGMDIRIPIVGLTLLTACMTWLKSRGYTVPAGSLFSGIYREVWTGVVKTEMTMNDVAPWAARIEDFSRYVSSVGNEAQVIHLAYMGVMPDVLINNTTYPIAIQDLAAEDIVIQLDKFQTKVTPITDDELYAITIEKMKLVAAKHARAININKYKKGIHALAPSANTADMPVLFSTGADDGSGRKRLTWEDVQKLKAKLDAKENPVDGNARVLVLSTDHVNDLTLVDQKFKDQYYNRADGKVYNQLGFDIYDYQGMPYYTTGGAKVSFGATPGGTDKQASVYFNLARAAKADGWIKTYLSEASKDPEMQRNLFSARHNFIILPTRTEARGAIISGTV